MRIVPIVPKNLKRDLSTTMSERCSPLSQRIASPDGPFEKVVHAMKHAGRKHPKQRAAIAGAVQSKPVTWWFESANAMEEAPSMAVRARIRAARPSPKRIEFPPMRTQNDFPDVPEACIHARMRNLARAENCRLEGEAGPLDPAAARHATDRRPKQFRFIRFDRLRRRRPKILRWPAAGRNQVDWSGAGHQSNQHQAADLRGAIRDCPRDTEAPLRPGTMSAPSPRRSIALRREGAVEGVIDRDNSANVALAALGIRKPAGDDRSCARVP